MSDQNARGKPKYESPVLVPLGELAKGSGICVIGSSVSGVDSGPGGPPVCSTGPSVGTGGPYCAAGPSTSGIPGYCTAGTTASIGACTSGATAETACTAGGTAITAACSSGSLPGA
jgi:hypothetical protein